MTSLLELEQISKQYLMAGQSVSVLEDVSFTVNRGEFVSIMGPSGSGKTTLMHILGCLDIPSHGRYRIDGQEVSGLSETQLTDVRRRRIGFVFQNFNLISTLNAKENVALPLLYQRRATAEQWEQATSALERVGLQDRLGHRPNQLSGGQQQRVAIARALVTTPPSFSPMSRPVIWIVKRAGMF